MNWQIRFHPEARRSLYRIRRGIAGEITEQLDALAEKGDPSDGLELVPETADIYQLEIHAHFFEFSLNDEEKIIRILNIE